ncbi:MAG: AfsR/SARP family transcriptional regulator [Nitrososphaerales archaeon]
MSRFVPDLNHSRNVTELTLRVYLLGPAWIQWQGQALSIGRRQTRALLYCLAAKRHPVAREELCFGFWPDRADAQAHRQLSHLLSHLRTALPDPELVQSVNDTIELDWNRVWCDASSLRAACTSLEPENAHELEQAIRYYRGPFLAGFSLPAAPEFELWVSEQRTLHERLYLDALRVLLRSEATFMDYDRAIKYARMYLQVDEMAEDIHRELMILHVMAGDRPAAIQQYKRCAAVLQRELGVEPLPETRAIYKAVLQNN